MESIKCTMKDVSKSMPALENLRKVDLPVKASLQILRIHKEIEKEFEIYLAEEKTIVERHAERDGEGNMVRPPLLDKDEEKVLDPEGNEVPNPKQVVIKNMSTFTADMDELLGAEVTFMLNKIPLELIEDIEISYNDTDALAFLIEL